MANGNRSSIRAFTLIEVLVSVAVITVLISLLVPSLARSREAARMVVCKSNFSEWSKAMLMYTQQFGGVLPYEDRPNPLNPAEKHRVCWYDAADRYFKSSSTNLSVKTCPTVGRDQPNSSEGYRMNSKLAETNPTSPGYMPYRAADRLKSAHSTVLLFDADVGGDVVSFKGRWRIHNDDVSYRHNRHTNLLYVAGNIETVHRRVLYKRSERNAPTIWQPADVGPWDPDPDPRNDQ